MDIAALCFFYQFIVEAHNTPFTSSRQDSTVKSRFLRKRFAYCTKIFIPFVASNYPTAS
jgi:hypothetical protein